MADEFQTGVCSSSWWNVEAVEAKAPAVPSEDSVASVSDSSLSFQDLHSAAPPAIPNGFLVDPQVAGFGHTSPSVDWNNDGSVGGSFHALLQDHISSAKGYSLQQANEIHQGGLFRDVSQAFLVGQQYLNVTGDESPGVSTAFFHGVMEPAELQTPQNDTYGGSQGYSSRANDVSPHMQWLRMQQQASRQSGGQFGTPPPWNSPASSTADLARSGIYGSTLNCQYMTQGIMGSSGSSNLVSMKVKNDTGRATMKKSSSEPSFKKPRIETPSPVPAFKVRKEKLGDRITALQQLVSPFGKTDTASVLYEAIEYIKFLHDQVNVLSTPYLKNKQHQTFEKTKEVEVVKKDLRSRGLCLVPISSTFAVANEPADFWTPSFGGTFR